MTTDEPPDVEVLVAELRAEAQRLRESIGPGRVPGPMSREEALAGVATVAMAPDGFGGNEEAANSLAAGGLGLDNLGALADPGDVAFHSHRARTGRFVVESKKVLRRLLTPILDRQAAFNRAAVDALASLDLKAGKRDTLLLRRIEDLEHRLAEAVGITAATAHTSAGFDARAFGERFRGSREQVKLAQTAYMEHFVGPSSGPIADLGCGRGEFLELLRAAGIEAWGIESDSAMVEELRSRGLAVREGDAVALLHDCADESLGGIVAFQVVEHLPFPRLVELLRLARRKLRVGGVLVLETVNVQSVYPWTRAWSMDPSHRHPLHPQTLHFLAEQAGFPSVDIVFSDPVDDATRLEEGPDEDRATRNARRLNELLFAPQDYALVART